MAGESRRQRRDARRATGETPAPIEAQVAPASPAGEAGGAVSVQRDARRGFIRQSWAELNKVEWPNRPQVVQGTVVVLIACAIVGAYLWGIDQALRPFVRDVLIG